MTEQETLFGIPAVAVEEAPEVEAAPPEPEQFENPAQETLFDMRPVWSVEWGGMPEFYQEDLTPVRSLIVHFESEEDVRKLEQLLGQPIGPNIKSIWFPESEICRYADKRYADEG